MTPLEHIFPEGEFKVSAPLSPAVRCGNQLWISGIPAYDAEGKLAVGDFTAQMNQVMAIITKILKEAGAGWDRVVKVNVFLTRREDFEEMNRIYAAHFPDGKYPARTTCIVYSLPRPNFLLEIECTAVLD
ncbi:MULTISPECIES: RidA family protein [Roseococcus]|uniref:Reactive intermediate/imine deaminase n=1 Tax=Roseococcus suduntuyensis TaxID=455361 RepID=A0A840AB13_9PROT|nr:MULTISPECIES: RidA family protein [Roseococcus]MBB3898341.1 reactive intermediate/imine deaminase [Roseococcus suduntuyensis]